MKKHDRKHSPQSGARPLSEPPRKADAPHGHPLPRAKPEERAHPAERKVKHKHRPEQGD